MVSTKFLLLACAIVCAATSEDHSIHVSEIVESFDADVSLRVTPNLLKGTEGWVELSLEGVSKPTKEDWIGIYSPANADPSKTAPIKYKMAETAKGYLESGKGKFRFIIYNMRSDYAFLFFRNGTTHPTAVAKSNTVNFETYNLPLHGRLALTNNPTEMRLTWGSNDTQNPQVRWGEVSGQYTSVASAKSYWYTENDMCGGVAKGYGWREPGIIHTAVMAPLVPGKRYFYQYGDEGSGGWSQESQFVATTPIGPTNGVRMAAYGDMGQGALDDAKEHNEMMASLNTTKNVIAKINDLDLVLHIGDISYSRGYSAEWDNFLAQVTPVASRLPYMTGIGNHERDYLNSGAHYNGTDSGGECGVPYEALLPMPTNGKDKPWYSFNYGNIHVVVMSSEHNFDIGSEQHSFLQQDMAAVNRDLTPWLIFTGHRPMYSTAKLHKTGYLAELRENLEELLIKYKVDLALFGHIHSYQRTCPVYKGVCTKGAPTHVIIGMAGAGKPSDHPPKKPEWMVNVNVKARGYSTIQTDQSSLTMNFYSNENELLDHFVLHK